MPALGTAAPTMTDARTIVEAALEHARGGQYPPMTVAVLDTAGQLVAFAREDDSSLLRDASPAGKHTGRCTSGWAAEGCQAALRNGIRLFCLGLDVMDFGGSASTPRTAPTPPCKAAPTAVHQRRPVTSPLAP